MEIVTVWITRTYAQDTPELVEAWTEYDIDGNYEGWERARDRAIASVEDDLHTHRIVNIHVDYDKIREAFLEANIDAEKVEVEDVP